MLRLASLALVVAVASALPTLPAEVNSTYSFDMPLAKFARDLSRASYCDEAAISAWNCQVCGGDFKIHHVISPEKNVAKLQGFVGYSEQEKRIVASFRGSSNLRNWLFNLAFARVDSDFTDQGCVDCKIHHGWFDAYNDIDAEVLQAVNELAAQFPDFRILTTGHSLGAAIAVHAALDLCVVHNHTARLDMITFGEPRLGNEEFAKFASASIPSSTRITHTRDMIPHMPPKEGLFPLDFHHEAREVWNTDDAETIQICDGSGEDDNCSKSVSLLRYSIKDHLWYLGAPSGCSNSLADDQEMADLVETQDMLIDYYAKQQRKKHLLKMQ